MSSKKEEYKSRIRIKIKAYDYKLADQSSVQIINTALKFGANALGPIPLPTSIKKYTVLKSTFVHKDSREQFEMRVHKRLIDIVEPNSKVIDALMNLNLAVGVDISIKYLN
jgi:small subunit ribosomal protein S10